MMTFGTIKKPFRVGINEGIILDRASLNEAKFFTDSLSGWW